MKSALIIVAPVGFQDHEFSAPYEALKNAGVRVEIASLSVGKCTGKFGVMCESTHSISDVSGRDYDAVVFIGGPGVLQNFKENQDYLRLALEAKILAAICITPFALASSGVFEGKRVTGWDSEGEQQAFLELHGATFTGDSVTVDENIITANGPASAEEFAEEILKKLGV